MGDLGFFQKALVIEDEVLIAVDIGDQLKDAGIGHVELVGDLEGALACLGKDRFDFVTMDVKLGQAYALPLAQILVKRKIPFIYVSGYGQPDETLPVAPWVGKPAMASDIVVAAMEALHLAQAVGR